MAKGLPEFCRGNPQKTSDYMRTLCKETGFSLREEDMVPNPAIKQVSKTLICSIIGKMGQMNKSGGKSVVHSMTDIRRLQNNKNVKITWYRLITPKVGLFAWKPLDSAIKSFKDGNFFCASLVTAISRRLLVSSCKMLERPENGYVVAYTGI